MLQDFVQVNDFDHTVTIATFTNGLRNKDFTKKSPKVFFDLLMMAEKYINLEKAMAIKYHDDDKVYLEKLLNKLIIK